MRLLLDTHVLLWWLDDRPVLGEKARRLIQTTDNQVFVSAISAAEIAIKSSLGRLRAPADLEQQLDENAFTPLPLTVHHGLAMQELPWHHRDPFDRLLIAQGRCEELAVLTADPAFTAYEVSVINAKA